MKEHNNIIIQALNDYLKIDNPGYGILIKGDWGCGKSFFVKQWKKSLEEGVDNDEHEEYVNLKPIYVSLNGVSVTSKIDEAIKREISPVLHGKFMKGVGKALKFAASVALRFNVDAVGDATPEQMVCTVDPKMLLECDPTKVRGKRILIFDDLERVMMPIGEVLGYINYFIEQAGCSVIMVGDDKNIDKQEDYKKIKEKTIGHEYRIETETEEALSVFIDEIDHDGKLGLKDLMIPITFCFQVSRVRNLRILRQSLFDYRLYVSHLSREIVESKEFSEIRVYLLLNFIAVYAEYKSGKVLMERFHEQLAHETICSMSDNDKSTPQEAMNLLSKYKKSGLTESHRVLGQGYVECVMGYLLEGRINEEFLMQEVKRDRSTPWERLSQYMSLSDDDFKKCLGETAGYLESGGFDQIDYLLMATCSMLSVIRKGMTHNYTTEAVIGWCLKAINGRFFPSCRTLDDLYRQKNHAHRCLSYYQSENIMEDMNKLDEGIEAAFRRVASGKNDTLTEILNALTDEKVEQIVPIYMNAVPDQSVTYSSHAIFAQVDPEKFIIGFTGLNNVAKVKFIQFVRHHYHQAFAATNADEFVHYYVDDLNKLPEIVSRLKDAASETSLVSKQNIEVLAETLAESVATIKELLTRKNKKHDIKIHI